MKLLIPLLLMIQSLFPVKSLGASDCKRVYPLGITQFKIRLVDYKNWQIGTSTEHQNWTPIPCTPGLDLDFFNGQNLESQNEYGVGHVGKNASFVFYPTENVTNLNFDIQAPIDLFKFHLIEIDLPETGKVFLNNEIYKKDEQSINGLSLEIYSEPANPAMKTALHVLDILTKLYPHHTKAMNAFKKTTLVLSRNSTENFQKEQVLPNGLHDPRFLYSLFLDENK